MAIGDPKEVKQARQEVRRKEAAVWNDRVEAGRSAMRAEAAEKAKAIIDAVPPRHPFNVRYEEKAKLERIEWEKCEVVLDDQAKRDALKIPWTSS